MLISQYGKIIRMDTNTIRESGRSAQGVRLLHLETGRPRGGGGGDSAGREPKRRRNVASVKELTTGFTEKIQKVSSVNLVSSCGEGLRFSFLSALEYFHLDRPLQPSLNIALHHLQ